MDDVTVVLSQGVVKRARRPNGSTKARKQELAAENDAKRTALLKRMADEAHAQRQNDERVLAERERVRRMREEVAAQFRDADAMLTATHVVPLSEAERLDAEQHFIYIMVLARKARAMSMPFHDMTTLLGYRYRLFTSTELHDCSTACAKVPQPVPAPPPSQSAARFMIDPATGRRVPVPPATSRVFTCTKASLQPNERFIDPVSRRPVHATGRVFMCVDSGRVHRCTGSRSCQLCSISPDRSELRCMFGNISLGAVISTSAYGSSANDELATDPDGMASVDHLEMLDAPSASEPSTPSVANSDIVATRAVRGRRPRARKTAVKVARALDIELAKRVRSLLFDQALATYWDELREQTLRNANAACDTLVRQHSTNTPPSLLWIHALAAFAQTAHKVSAARPLFATEPRALNKQQQARAVEYFVQCVSLVVEKLLKTEKATRLSIDPANLAMGVLYRMRTGYDQTVYYNGETRRVLNDRLDEYAKLPPELACEERVQFLQPHAFLNVRLPLIDYAKRCGAVHGNNTVTRLLNSLTACYVSLLSSSHTIEDVRQMRLAEMVSPAFMSEDGV